VPLAIAPSSWLFDPDLLTALKLRFMVGDILYLKYAASICLFFSAAIKPYFFLVVVFFLGGFGAPYNEYF
jgi:hypothetical protein